MRIIFRSIARASLFFFKSLESAQPEQARQLKAYSKFWLSRLVKMLVPSSNLVDIFHMFVEGQYTEIIIKFYGLVCLIFTLEQMRTLVLE